MREAYDGFLSISKDLEKIGVQSDTLKKQIQVGLHECEELLKKKNTTKPYLSTTLIKYLHTETATETLVPTKYRKEGNANQNVHSSTFELNYGGTDVGWQLITSKSIQPGRVNCSFFVSLLFSFSDMDIFQARIPVFFAPRYCSRSLLDRYFQPFNRCC